MSPESPERDSQLPTSTQQFLTIIKEKIGTSDEWTMGVEILGPRNETNHLMPVLGYLVIIPIAERYGLQHYSGIEPCFDWCSELDQNGNPYELVGISEQELYEELGLLLDPQSPLEDPRFKVNVIDVADEGDFELPEGHGFHGTILNEDVHVGGVVISFELLSAQDVIDKF